MSRTKEVPASSRSQHRREEIVDAAASLFSELGYHRVGIDDVAGKVGITGGAIYKHFTGKQDLLARAIDGALLPTEAAVSGARDVTAAITALAAEFVDHRRNGLLLTREIRALKIERSRTERRRIDAVRAMMAALVGGSRPGLPAIDCRLLADAVLALMFSTAHHTVTLPRHRSIGLLGALALRTVDVELPERSPSVETSTRNNSSPATLVGRRDLLVDAAIDQFGRRGYRAATMEDLGAAASIAGPSIYQHFSSKAELLVAVFTRGNEGLRLGLSRAFAEGRDAADTLGLLVASYVDFVLGHPAVNSLLMNEQIYLPELERASVRRMQHRYVGEWVNLLQATHPGLNHDTARFITHAVLSVVNYRGRAEAGDRHRLHQVLVSVSRELLLTPTWSEVTA